MVIHIDVTDPFVTLAISGFAALPIIFQTLSRDYRFSRDQRRISALSTTMSTGRAGWKDGNAIRNEFRLSAIGKPEPLKGNLAAFLVAPDR